jgi:hypothetical protein
MMFFQSLALPLKAILMNLASIMATYGVLVLVFGHGIGIQVYGVDAIGALSVVTPVILFVILFGLSTDYEVFMLSRVKEYYHHTGNNEEAVATGLETTAGVITAAGLILIGTFGSFSLARVISLKETGLGLAVGVLLDSTIVRIIMVPATMRLMGNANWYMPRWLKKIVPELREGPAEEFAPAGAPALAAAGAPAPLPPAYPGQPAFAGVGAPPPPPVNMPARAGSRRVPPQLPRGATIGLLHATGASVGTNVIRLPRSRPFRIGRAKESELRLFDARISRQHALIDYDPRLNSFIVTDLGSSNGVYVNDHRVDRPTVLRDGDRLEIGNLGVITFAFESQPDPRYAAAPAGAPAR